MDEPQMPEDELRRINDEIRNRIPRRHANLLADIEQYLVRLARDNPMVIDWELPDLDRDQPTIRLRVQSDIDRDLVPNNIHGIRVVPVYLYAPKPTLRLVRDEDRFDRSHPVFKPPPNGEKR